MREIGGDLAGLSVVDRWRRVGEVARLFVRLGATVFGGPAAHIAVMADECVGRRGWVSREVFADLLSAANVIPGPSSTELAMLLGRHRAGWPGFLAAGVAFVLPVTVIVWIVAWWYARSSGRPEVAVLLRGVQPVIVAVVLQAIWRLGKGVLTRLSSVVIVVASVAALVFGVHELIVFVLAGAAALLWRKGASGMHGAGAMFSARGTGSAMMLSAAAAGVAGAAASASAMFLVFLKIGATTFGSGYVLLGFLRTEIVERRHWLSAAQVYDAIAIGQVTPGPVFSTATFVGFLIGGNIGAIAATTGIFLPAFVFAAISGVVVTRVRASEQLSAVLDGVNAASLALLVVAMLSLARYAIVDVEAMLVATIALALLASGRVTSTLVVLGGVAYALVRMLIA